MKHLDDNTYWVSEMLKKDFYVDDVICCFTDESTIIKYFNDIRDLMSDGFNLRSWNSSSCHLRALSKEDGKHDSNEITILGMRWNAVNDQIFLTERSIKILGTMTKRVIIKETAKLYAPLGFFCLITS
jgi:hypothetical protein